MAWVESLGNEGYNAPMKWWVVIPIGLVLLGLFGIVAPEAAGARVICDGEGCGYQNGPAFFYLLVGSGWLWWLWAKDKA